MMNADKNIIIYLIILFMDMVSSNEDKQIVNLNSLRKKYNVCESKANFA